VAVKLQPSPLPPSDPPIKPDCPVLLHAHLVYHSSHPRGLKKTEEARTRMLGGGVLPTLGAGLSPGDPRCNGVARASGSCVAGPCRCRSPAGVSYPVEENGRPPVARPNLSGYPRDRVTGPVGAALRGRGSLETPVLWSALTELHPPAWGSQGTPAATTLGGRQPRPRARPRARCPGCRHAL
jgi:hypothetical protein